MPPPDVRTWRRSAKYASAAAVSFLVGPVIGGLREVGRRWLMAWLGNVGRFRRGLGLWGRRG